MNTKINNHECKEVTEKKHFELFVRDVSWSLNVSLRFSAIDAYVNNLSLTNDIFIISNFIFVIIFIIIVLFV